MATTKTTQPNYFGNLRTPAANFANSSGINTFDATTTYFDNTNITFDKV